METTEQQPNGNGQWVDPALKVQALLEQNASSNREGFVSQPDVTIDAPDQEQEQSAARSEPEHPEPEQSEQTDHSQESEQDDAEPDQPDHDADAPDHDQADQGEPLALDIASLAEKLDVPVADLYAMEIPLGGDREPITLGQFKDHVQDLYTVEDRQEALEAQKIEHENQVLQDQQELLAMINESGVELTPELRSRAAQAQQIHASQQRELLFSAIPAWKDNPETYQRDRAAMVETLGNEYGLTEAQIGAQGEAVTIKMMHDLTRLLRMERLSNAAAKKVPKLPRRPGKPRRQSAKSQKQSEVVAAGRAATDPYDKAQAVKALLSPKM